MAFSDSLCLLGIAIPVIVVQLWIHFQSECIGSGFQLLVSSAVLL